jgi:endonuclease/exonuclease/phosphatase family metal-dependent hydrolase
MVAVAQTKTFKVACLNVDGLPPSISVLGNKISLNPDGGQEAGATRISELIAHKGWDFFGVSEDFNYHDELMSQISDYYNAGWYRGKVSTSNTTLDGKLKINTDGLDLIWKKTLTASGETCVKWSKTNGYTSNGSDELLLKGYRYYCVTVANGLAVDVYIHHMDAETDDADVAARESQINQLVAAIKASDNHRPIIIMGDTNCRYTRDNLKTLLIDAINEDSRFDIHDPWVDMMWDGVFPTYGSDAMMTHTYGDQKGEVVDKIFYINNTDANGITLTANSYLHDTDFSYADGTSISDHYPVVVEFTIENSSDNVMAGSYYLRNVATGTFLAAGGNWGTHAVVDEVGNYITLEQASDDGNYYIHSTCGYLSLDGWMDKSSDERGTFSVTHANDGYLHITYVDNGTMALTATDSRLVNGEPLAAGNLMQEWELVSRDELTLELYEASDAAPKDATFLISGAGFNRNDSAVDSWATSKDGGLSINKGGLNVDSFDSNYIVEFYNGQIGSLSTTKTSGSMSQTIALPNGRYRVSVQAFKREEGDNFSITANDTSLDIPLMANQAQATQLHEGATQLESGLWVPNTIESAAAFFNAGLYTTTAEFTVTDRSLTLKINKEHTKSTKWYAFDNFRLSYLGTTVEESVVYNYVKAAMDDAAAKAEALNLNNFNNSTVEERYHNHLIVGDGSEEVKMTYVALANATKSQSQIPADMRYAVLNNDFEMGTLDYWTVENGGVVVANNATYGGNGSYLFAGNGGATVEQSTEEMGITLPNGIYELTALVSNGVQLFANDEVSEAAVVTDGKLTEATVRFPVVSGKALLGAKSATNFYVDNFVLTRVADASSVSGIDMLAVAIVDATERVTAMGAPYSNGWDLSAYTALVENSALEGDGTTEFNEIYTMLRARVAQRINDLGAGTDATDAIINPSFEFGKPWGWSIVYSSDTDVMLNEGVYVCDGCDGSYLYNTWWQGTPVIQTVSGLPTGHYRMTTKVASDAGATLYIMANDVKLRKSITKAKEYFEEVAVEFDLHDGEDVTFTVVGGDDDGNYVEEGYWWYKTDDFHLTFLSDQLDGINRVAVDTPDTIGAKDALNAIPANAPVDLYAANGVLLRRNVPYAEALTDLAHGIYILRYQSLTLKLAR